MPSRTFQCYSPAPGRRSPGTPCNFSAIPRGAVRTYGHLAKVIGSHPRAVGQACGANWFPLVIPCHRVTASGGLGGFSNQNDENGFHLSVKRWLLRHEGATAAPWQQQSIWP